MAFWRERIFPHILDFSVSSPELNSLREHLLAHAKGKILEVGFGSGLNLPYLPAGTESIVAIEPNEGMRRKAQERERASTVKVEWHHVDAESLPFADGTFDTVITTLTLCSLKNTRTVLREVRRVMKHDGRFLFLEHGLDPNPNVQRVQRFINPIQKRFADGCDMTMKVDSMIRENGFIIEELATHHVRSVANLKPYFFVGVARPELSPSDVLTGFARDKESNARTTSA